MPPGTLAFQGLESIAGRDHKITDGFSRMKGRQFAGGNSRDLSKPPVPFRAKKLFRIFATKRTNHDPGLSIAYFLRRVSTPRR